MFQLYQRMPAKETYQGFHRGPVALLRPMRPSALIHRSIRFVDLGKLSFYRWGSSEFGNILITWTGVIAFEGLFFGYFDFYFSTSCYVYHFLTSFQKYLVSRAVSPVLARYVSLYGRAVHSDTIALNFSGCVLSQEYSFKYFPSGKAMRLC